MVEIRRAKPLDAPGIHKAHMRSIRTLCAQDYSPEEILAWGQQPYREDQWRFSIQNDLVWVIEQNGQIEGYAHLVLDKSNHQVSFIWGLYLTAEVSQKGLGKQALHLILNEAQARGLKVLKLESSLTAHGFYLRHGFKDTGEPTNVLINKAKIRCVPMELKIADE